MKCPIYRQWQHDAIVKQNIVVSRKEYSKISLETALAKMGKYETLMEFLKSIEVVPGYTAYTAWNSAQVLANDYPGWDTIYPIILDRLNLTKEEGDAILEQCIAK